MEEKIIKKLIKQAKEVQHVKIPQENLIEISLEEIYKQKGELCYNNHTFYRKGDENWFMAKLEVNELEDIKKRIENIEKWCGDIKKYIDLNLEIIRGEICGGKQY